MSILVRIWFIHVISHEQLLLLKDYGHRHLIKLNACMIELIQVIKCFYPNDEQYLKDLSTLSFNIIAVKLLVDVCEPLGLDGRDFSPNYTTQTALNRFVDVLKPESAETRRLIKSTNLSLLYLTFVSWKRNNLKIYSNDTVVLQLSENLFRLGEIGIRLVKLFDKNQQRQIVSSRWFYYQQYILDTLEYQIPEIRLAGVRVLRNLFEEFDPCSFDLINLSLILFFPIVVIIVLRVSFIRRRLLLPCLNLCYYNCARC